jgi:uncharacterized protein YecA (UPF0149 family)
MEFVRDDPRDDRCPCGSGKPVDFDQLKAQLRQLPA